ncbi:MAG: TetR/AcrR family transcriptional regulator [Alphaproteobacteria bacterium]|nr:TetR/AcrR family transcriptional regulator [Alphaproteobacteria bacterium]MBU0797186.1 TetR/AcrR family transcriptional regulator [Alphaproteobacteria bacterium]MBU0887143.1 TetR/AcrR family transcriptional regulator [Alphaproteobacteria bacterium]MBU1814393.1 TetR/AcrR family transcriptional regulator [Alphaproteobacteria bacterium]
MMRPHNDNADHTAQTKLEQVADAARRLFARYGYKRTSMDDIAREAGVAKATLYLHFKGKEDVFRTVLLRTRDLMLQRCDAAQDGDTSFRARLEAMLNAYYGTWLELFGDAEHWGELYLVKTQIALEDANETEAMYVERFCGFLEAADASGEISLARVEATPDRLCQTLRQAAIGAKSGTPPTLEEYRQRLAAIAALAAAALKA